MNYSTRRAVPADATGLERLNLLFNEIHVDARLLTERLAAPDPIETVLVVEADGRPVGFACLIVTTWFCYNEPMAHLSELFVEEEYRRRNIARALLSEAEKMARAAGAVEIDLTTENPDAMALYSLAGFTQHGISMRKKFLLE